MVSCKLTLTLTTLFVYSTIAFADIWLTHMECGGSKSIGISHSSEKGLSASYWSNEENNADSTVCSYDGVICITHVQYWGNCDDMNWLFQIQYENTWSKGITLNLKNKPGAAVSASKRLKPKF
ncbi:uncharacterized protein B0P05DRAFT_310851 [Gilbertella persicaria]|uniref:uncharacterized protein n=1 Tax=Gilbertella persicaria TaxID=101096 RepID=UPI00222094BC|nr:uncharacterized protein B0P05DRAFT_310851 [Gilbertella persicaria]KAI8052593.1 hypothetical protein B0P05DRAFT_310851 [Gilbertella persicaria]